MTGDCRGRPRVTGLMPRNRCAAAQPAARQDTGVLQHAATVPDWHGGMRQRAPLGTRAEPAVARRGGLRPGHGWLRWVVPAGWRPALRMASRRAATRHAGMYG